MTDATDEITLVLVDDQSLIRTGFSTILATEPGITVIGEAANGAEAIEVVANLKPDVVCMDVQMPVMNGIDATKAIVAREDIPSAVLILTTFDRDDFIFEALDAGASGFMLKTAGPEELINAVRVLSAGDSLLAPEITRRVLQRFTAQEPWADHVRSTASTGLKNPPDALADAAGPEVFEQLTNRETEILQMVAAGMPNTQIADTLFIGTATVKTHVSNILSKLRVKDRLHAVIWAYEYGVINS